MKVVVNATPIIALSLVDKFTLLKDLFNEVIIPKAVFEEVAEAGKGKVGQNSFIRIAPKLVTWFKKQLV